MVIFSHRLQVEMMGAPGFGAHPLLAMETWSSLEARQWSRDASHSVEVFTACADSHLPLCPLEFCASRKGWFRVLL